MNWSVLPEAYGEPHAFLSGDCTMCHIDEKTAPEAIKVTASDSCTKCHKNIESAFNHPVDMYPYKNTIIPANMPLTERRVTCLTCHYAHPIESGMESTFVRGESSGSVFCVLCHKNDSREHVLIGKAHLHPDKVKIEGSVDEISMLCIECHEMGRYFDWGKTINTCQSKLNHPVGVLYQTASDQQTGMFCPVVNLSKEINLFGGKIGCGTCHNIYSPIRNLLVMSNKQSNLCTQCHFECMGC
jgi:predicted CXXCH cytochrome family protein